mgnify:CR=1 FL=1|tara:strand:+ start:11 stop:598 length:588 start_codon:yes stop_codon:yes gene_type:complete
MVLVTESRAKSARDPRVARCLEGDTSAFEELYDELAPEIRRFLTGLRLPLPIQDHEDALQETLLRLYRGLTRYDGRRPLVAYALGIARHVAVDLCRKAPPPSSPQGPDDQQGVGSTSDRVHKAEQGRLVDLAMRALDPELRSVLTLRHINELRMQDLADSLGCSLPTARARLREAGHRFAIELRRLGVVPGEVTS